MASKLPEEVVAHLLSFLSLSDRKACSLVCWRWYHASRYPQLMRDIVTQMSVTRNAHKASHPEWQFSLVNVSFRGLDLTSQDFVRFLSACPRLQSLDLSCCNSLVLGGDKSFLANSEDIARLKATLTSLRHLNLTSLRHLTDVTFNRLVAIAENLTSLNLSGCPISFVGQIASSVRMNCLLTFPNIFNFLKEQRRLMTSLDFSQTSITDAALESIACISGLQLTALFINRCQELTDKGIEAISARQPSLEVFSMAFNSQLRSVSVSNLLARCPGLQVLDLSQCGRLQEGFLKTLGSHCDNLRCLNLSLNNTLTGPALGRCFASKRLHTVTMLNLAHCVNEAVNDDVVAHICATMVHLRLLDLTSSFRITDHALRAICRSLVRLDTLKLGWCKRLTDCGFLGLEAAAKEEEEAAICNCCLPADAKNRRHANGLLLSRRAHASLESLSRLRVLDVSKCGLLSDCTFVHGLRLNELQQLNASMLRGLTDKTLVALAGHTPSLEVLNLASTRITDHGLAVALPKLTRLRVLNVASCDYLTDLCLETMLQHSAALRDVDVSYCGLISEQKMDQFEMRAKQLVSVGRLLIGSKMR